MRAERKRFGRGLCSSPSLHIYTIFARAYFYDPLPTDLFLGVLFLALVSQAFLLAAIYECRGLPSPPSGVIGNLSTTGVGSVSNRSLDLPFLLSHSALFSTDKGRLRESVAQCPGLSPREVGSDDRRLPFPSRG